MYHNFKVYTISKRINVWQFLLPDNFLIHQGFRCTKHGELLVYVNEKYSHKLRNLREKSDMWEGLFIGVNGYDLSKTSTIGNIYGSADDNNDNKNMEKFIDEISPIIDIIPEI